LLLGGASLSPRRAGKIESMDDVPLFEAVKVLADRSRAQGLRVAVAESCTGGWLAKCCTDLPGSSDWFECGWATYSNAAKSQLLGVDPELIRCEGAVSGAVVEAMAAGVLERTQCDLVCAISGVAGPSGGTEHAPVGCVWFAFLRSGGEACSERRDFPGDRDAVRRESVLYALRRLAEEISP